MHIKSATFALEEAIPILYQRYAKGMQKAGNFFVTTFGTRKLFSKNTLARNIKTTCVGNVGFDGFKPTKPTKPT